MNDPFEKKVRAAAVAGWWPEGPPRTEHALRPAGPGTVRGEGRGPDLRPHEFVAIEQMAPTCYSRSYGKA